MNKTTVFAIFIIALLLTPIIVTAQNNSTSSTNSTIPNVSPQECRTQCSLEKRENTQDCRTEYRECRSDCSQAKKSCIQQARDTRTTCRESCEDTANERSCKRECSLNYREERKQCSSRECSNDCREEKSDCRENIKEIFDMCKDQCLPPNQQVGVLEKYDFSVGEATCENAGGYFERLCKGPFFGVVCSPQKYCQCQGNDNFTCPAEYECVEDHGIVVKGRGHSIPGWRNLLGQDLGNIGVCGKLVE